MNLDKINKLTEGKTRTDGISPFMELELTKVYPNPDQPRKKFALAEIIELAESIEQNGLMQPIVVSKISKGYIIVSGERRYKAHLHAKIPTIKAHILDADENKILELALVENIIREDLTDMEISLHINKLWLSGRYSDKGGLATAIGKSATYISKALSVIKLDKEIVEHIKETNSSIGLSVLNEIATIKEPEVQKEVYDKYKNGEITRDGIVKIKSDKKTELHWNDFTKGEAIEFERVDVVDGVVSIILQKHLVSITLKGDSEGDFTVSVILEEDSSSSVVEHTSGHAITNDKNMVKALNLAQALINKDPIAFRKGIKQSEKAKEAIKAEALKRAQIKEKKETPKPIKQTDTKATKVDYPIDSKLEYREKREKFDALGRELKYLKDCRAEEAKERCIDSGYFMKLDWWDDDMHYHYNANKKVFVSGIGHEEKDLKFLEGGTFVFFEVKVSPRKETAPSDGCWEKVEEENESTLKPTKPSAPSDVEESRSVEELLKEIDELQTKELYIIGYAHKKGTPNGGGHRVRATNRNEAIELAKEYYKGIAQDKKMIFSATTLKELEDDIKSHKKCVVVCLGSKNSESEDFTFMADDGVHTKLEGYLKIDKLKAHKRYKVTIEEI